MLRRSIRPDVEEYITARSDRLLRTAYLLTGDRDRAERLLQQGLAQAWSSWHRGDLEPESAVRTAMVRLHVSWWHDLPWGRGDHRAARRGTTDQQDDRWLVLGRLSRRQRAALVLCYVEDLPDTDAAEVLRCPVSAVQRLTSRAVARARFEDPASELDALADGVHGVGAAVRLAEVEHRVGLRRAWRRTEAVGSLVVVTAVAAAVAAVLPSAPPDEAFVPPEPDMVQPPPLLVGYQLPTVVRVRGVDYEYFRSEESPPGRESLRVAVASNRRPQALAWVSPPALTGRIVLSVDGEVVTRHPAGSFDRGVLLAARRPHLVVVRATKPNVSMRLGIAVYRWPRS